MIFKFEKQTKKNHSYAILNYKCSAKKTTGQWTYTYGQGDQRVKADNKISFYCKVRESCEQNPV